MRGYSPNFQGSSGRSWEENNDYHPEDLKVSIVILNWNGKKYLEQYLPPLIRCTDPELAETVVADNGSVDGSPGWVRANHPEIRVIQNPQNLGFSEGYNRALDHLQNRYFLLLNSDVEVSPGWLEPLVETLDNDPSIAACMPKLMDQRRKDFFEYAGAAGGFIDRYGYTFCRGRIFNHLERDSGQFDRDCDIFWSTGACMLVRADLFRAAGGFDEHFFAHMEEIDLCWRLKNMGYRIRYCYRSVVYHLGGGSLPRSNVRKAFLNYRNNLMLLYKNLPLPARRKVIAFKLVLDAISAVRLLLIFRSGESMAVFRAHLDFFRKIPRMRRARIKPPHTKRFREYREVYDRGIAFMHFIRGVKTFGELGYHDRF